MSVRNLVRFFSTFTRLPIEPDDVKGQIIEQGIRDEITFVGVDLDPDVLSGYIHSYTQSAGPYAESAVCSDIYYNRRLGSDWQRFVACKELLHLFDHSRSRTKSKDQLCRLIHEMSYGERSGLLANGSLQAKADVMMVLYAIALVVPYEARDVILPAYRDGLVSCAQVAALADIPEQIVRLALDDRWEATYELLLEDR